MELHKFKTHPALLSENEQELEKDKIVHRMKIFAKENHLDWENDLLKVVRDYSYEMQKMYFMNLWEASGSLKESNEIIISLIDENLKFRKAIELIGAQAGLPDAGDGCRAIIKTVKEALK